MKPNVYNLLNWEKFSLLEQTDTKKHAVGDDFDPVADQKFRRCLIKLMSNAGFFAPLVARLRRVQHNNLPHKTMATDGMRVFYDKDFVNKLSEAEVIFVIAHETMHCAMGHFARMNGRDHQVWNMACDYAINPLLGNIPAGGGMTAKMPPMGLIDSKYDGMSAEQIYDILMKQMQGQGGGQGKQGQQGQGQGKGQGQGQGKGQGGGSGSGQPGGEMMGEVVKPGTYGNGGEEGEGQGEGQGDKEGENGEGGQDGEGQGNGQGQKRELKIKGYDPIEDPESLAKEWQRATVASASQNRGTLAGALKRWAESLGEAVVDWRAELKNFVKALSAKNSYKLPNRRFLGSNQILYGSTRKMTDFDQLVITIDTSGSISDTMIKRFVTELYGICKIYNPKDTYILYVDTRIASIDHFQRGGKPDLTKAAGGGGTSFVEPFKWVEKNILKKPEIKLSCFIYFTDLYGDFPDPKDYKIETYKNKVIWGVIGAGSFGINRIEPPFGKTIPVIETE